VHKQAQAMAMSIVRFIKANGWFGYEPAGKGSLF
jgi:hypothetical protein